MPFDPKQLPPTVYAAYQLGPMAWALVVERAMGVRIYDLNKLTDIVFYLHYPERVGKPLKPHETELINKWKAFRTLIMPRHQVNLARVGRLHTESMDTKGTGGGGGGWSSGMNYSKIDLWE